MNESRNGLKNKWLSNSYPYKIKFPFDTIHTNNFLLDLKIVQKQNNNIRRKNSTKIS